MPYQVLLTPGAARSLRKLPASARGQVIPVLHALADAPRPVGCTKLKAADDHYRVRIGDYRALYNVDDAGRVVLVTFIAHRRDVYR